jgi:hypothetical protein
MRGLALCMAMLLLGPLLMAQEKSQEKSPAPKQEKALTPAEQFAAITKEYAKALADFFTEYQKATTDQERQKIVQMKYPKADDVASKCLDLARKNPKEAFAPDALLWVVQKTRGSKANEAVKILLKDHIQSPKMDSVPRFLLYSGMPQADDHLRTLLEKNKDKKVQGFACLSLAQLYKMRAEDPKTPDAKRERLYGQATEYCDRVVKDFADVKSYRPLGDLAKSELFEIKNLRIGQIAPIIEGEDIDGKKFSLKDYRGKVVMLDFWGNW